MIRAALIFAISLVAPIHAAASECEIPDPAPHLASDAECEARGTGPIACEEGRKAFVADWEGALTNANLDAMRRVAQQLAVDDRGVLNQNPMLACAFYRAILGSGDLGITQADYDQISEGICSDLFLGVEQQLAAVEFALTIRRVQSACG